MTRISKTHFIVASIFQNIFSAFFMIAIMHHLYYLNPSLVGKINLNIKYFSEAFTVLPIFYILFYHSIVILNFISLYIYLCIKHNFNNNSAKIFYGGFSSILFTYLLGSFIWIILGITANTFYAGKDIGRTLLSQNIGVLVPYGGFMLVGFLLSNICFMSVYIPISEYLKRK